MTVRTAAPRIEICRHCLYELELRHGVWVHATGGRWFQRCRACRWYGAPKRSQVYCPRCGGQTVGDDHAAEPIP